MLPLVPVALKFVGTAVGAYIVGKAMDVTGINDGVSNFLKPQIKRPDSINSDGNLADLDNGYYSILFMPLVPSDNDIKSIDDYFTSFGYRVDIFDVPNLAVRPDFTYVKTRDAVVKSHIKQASDQLATMLNSGCKFWRGEIGE